MTGLDIEKDQIIEMACIITDSDLNILVEVMLINRSDASAVAVFEEILFLSLERGPT